MGFFDLNWKGKAKATPSSTTNHNTASLFSQSQPPPPPTPRWVQTPHWNQAEASSSSSSSRNLEPEPSEHSEKVRDMPKSHWKQKAGARRNTCEHKINCRLSNPRCCACLDRRPLTRAYFIYKDGRGLVPEGTRWENYCPGCERMLGPFFTAIIALSSCSILFSSLNFSVCPEYARIYV